MKKALLILLFLNINLCFSQAVIQQTKLFDAALELTKQSVTYGSSYFSIDLINKCICKFFMC
jgi:hypothetical protein